MATTSKKKSGGSGLSALVTPSSDLAAIVGSNAMPRSEITKKVWDYIKANGLQDQTNKRMINADDKLRKIFLLVVAISLFPLLLRFRPIVLYRTLYPRQTSIFR